MTRHLHLYGTLQIGDLVIHSHDPQGPVGPHRDGESIVIGYGLLSPEECCESASSPETTQRTAPVCMCQSTPLR